MRERQTCILIITAVLATTSMKLVMEQYDARSQQQHEDCEALLLKRFDQDNALNKLAPPPQEQAKLFKCLWDAVVSEQQVPTLFRFFYFSISLWSSLLIVIIVAAVCETYMGVRIFGL